MVAILLLKAYNINKVYTYHANCCFLRQNSHLLTEMTQLKFRVTGARHCGCNPLVTVTADSS